MPCQGSAQKEEKEGHNGQGAGVLRWSKDGGRSWLGNASLWHGFAYSYSCLTDVLAEGFIGLAWETVLPNSGHHKRDISANNVRFTLTPCSCSCQPNLIG